MSSDEQDRPRKTLTIKKTARDARAESEAAPAKRSRSGAAPPGRPDRARQGKIERLKTPDAPARAGDGERARASPWRPEAPPAGPMPAVAGAMTAARRAAAGARPARARATATTSTSRPPRPRAASTIRSRTTARRRNSPRAGPRRRDRIRHRSPRRARLSRPWPPSARAPPGRGVPGLRALPPGSGRSADRGNAGAGL